MGPATITLGKNLRTIKNKNAISKTQEINWGKGMLARGFGASGVPTPPGGRTSLLASPFSNCFSTLIFVRFGVQWVSVQNYRTGMRRGGDCCWELKKQQSRKKKYLFLKAGRPLIPFSISRNCRKMPPHPPPIYWNSKKIKMTEKVSADRTPSMPFEDLPQPPSHLPSYGPPVPPNYSL